MTNPTVSTFNDLDLANTGLGINLSSDIVVDGTLSSAGGVVPTVSGAATTVTTSGLAIDGVVFDNAPLIVNNGPTTQFDNVTFQNMDRVATQLTINHP